MKGFSLAQLQEEQVEWVAHNFPNRSIHHPLLGVMEEIGELHHVHLKAEQKIRYSDEQVLAKRKDAIADIMVYLSDYCSAIGIDLDLAYRHEIAFPHYSVMPLTTNQARLYIIVAVVSRIVAYQHEIEIGYEGHTEGMQCSAADHEIKTRKSISQEIGSLVFFVQRYADLYGINFMECVEETWNKVKQRDWKKNPMNANQLVEGSL